MTANINRDPKKQPKAIQPWDFFPSLKEFDHTESNEAARWHHWAMTHNARLKAERQDTTTE